MTITPKPATKKQLSSQIEQVRHGETLLIVCPASWAPVGVTSRNSLRKGYEVPSIKRRTSLFDTSRIDDIRGTADRVFSRDLFGQD